MRLLSAALAATVSVTALAQAPIVQPTVETREIGPWLLACKVDPITDRTDCTLRHRLWIVPPEGHDGPGIALEVVLRDGRALPAVTARALTLADASRGALALAASAELRLDQAPALELLCGLEGRDAVCLPTSEPATRVEAALAAASRALVRLRTAARIAGGGGEVYALELARTAEAIAALKERGPGAPPPPSPARSFLEELERLIRSR
jgi:hypothetical protein